MEKGTWTFRCRKCCETFELLLTEKDRASEFAQEKRCPSCGQAPSNPHPAPAMTAEHGHKVIGYRPEKNTRPFLI